MARYDPRGGAWRPADPLPPEPDRTCPGLMTSGWSAGCPLCAGRARPAGSAWSPLPRFNSRAEHGILLKRFEKPAQGFATVAAIALASIRRTHRGRALDSHAHQRAADGLRGGLGALGSTRLDGPAQGALVRPTPMPIRIRGAAASGWNRLAPAFARQAGRVAQPSGRDQSRRTAHGAMPAPMPIRLPPRATEASRRDRMARLNPRRSRRGGRRPRRHRPRPLRCRCAFAPLHPVRAASPPAG